MTLAPLADRYPNRATSWKLRSRTLEFGRKPLLMGIVNVTPDSFSDGGEFLDSQAAVDQALRLVSEGADILDVGGESTRPYSEPVALQEELDRILPVVEAIADKVTVPISIDTSKSQVARAALDVGVEIVNDVTGLAGDAAMLPLVAEYQPGVCAMHMRGTPQTMQDKPHYNDVVREVGDYLANRAETLSTAGLDRQRVCLDPGIGFGKTHQHNLTLMAGCGSFHRFGCPLLVGHSRKGFLAKLMGDERADRTVATVGAALALAVQGVQVIRVHEVRLLREALVAFEAVGGIDGVEAQLAD